MLQKLNILLYLQRMAPATVTKNYNVSTLHIKSCLQMKIELLDYRNKTTKKRYRQQIGLN